MQERENPFFVTTQWRKMPWATHQCGDFSRSTGVCVRWFRIYDYYYCRI